MTEMSGKLNDPFVEGGIVFQSPMIGVSTKERVKIQFMQGKFRLIHEKERISDLLFPEGSYHSLKYL